MKLKISFSGWLCAKGKEKNTKVKADQEPVLPPGSGLEQPYFPEYILIFLLALMLVVLLLSGTVCKAQGKAAAGLKVGDPLPEGITVRVLNYPSPRLNLSGLKGKLLILDFWATWCGSCISHFREASVLQSRYRDDLQLLLVNSKRDKDTKEKIMGLFQRQGLEYPGGFPLPSVYDDTVLTRFFPHYSIPHYVWIGKDGRVKAITSASELTDRNILALLKTDTLATYNKVDVPHDQPLYTESILPKNNLVHYSILLKGKIDGLGGGMRPRKINDTIRGMVFNNRSLLELYQMAASQLIPNFNPKQTILRLRDTSALEWTGPGPIQGTWKRANLYSFELIVPAAQFPGFYTLMLADLNHYSGFTGTIQKQTLQCWVLTAVGSPQLLVTKGGAYGHALSGKGHIALRNATMMNLCEWLNTLGGANEPVIDETHSLAHFDADLSAEDLHGTAIHDQLLRYGLKLTLLPRSVDVLQITHP